MKISDKLRRFINQNAKLIDNNEFDTLFSFATYSNIILGELAELLMKADVAFLPYVDHIYMMMFQGMQELEKLILGDNIEYIGVAAFEDCTNLEYLSLPKTLKRIKPTAFTNCRNLQILNYQGTVDDWSKIDLNPGWRYNSSIKVIKCLDRDIELE